MADQERGIRKVTYDRRVFFRGLGDVGKGVLARPTRGLGTAIRIGQQIAEHPELVGRAIDSAKKGIERFQVTPRAFSPDWNFAAAGRLMQNLGDPELTVKYGAALEKAGRDTSPAECMLLDQVDNNPDVTLTDLCDFYAAVGKIDEYDSLIEGVGIQPRDTQSMSYTELSRWSATLLRNASAKTLHGKDPQPDIQAALNMLLKNRHVHPVKAYARANSVYHACFSESNSAWLAQVLQGLRDPKVLRWPQVPREVF